jgi:hypothetical protein
VDHNDEMLLDGCPECGASVKSPKKHAEWHRTLADKIAEEFGRGIDGGRTGVGTS